MHLLYIFIFLIKFFTNTFAVPLPEPVADSVYVHINSFIDKCPYLKTTKLFYPQPEFLSNCTNFAAAKSLTKLNRDNINQAVCLLYYNSVRQLCTETISKPIVTNEIIETALRTYQTDTEKVCSIIINNTFIAEEIRPGIDSVYNYLHKGDCFRLCTDFDGVLNSACILTAFAINTSDFQFSRDANHKAKPNVTTHNADHPSIHQENLVNEQNSNNVNINNDNNNIRLTSGKPEDKPKGVVIDGSLLLQSQEDIANAHSELERLAPLEQLSSTSISPINPDESVKLNQQKAIAETPKLDDSDLGNISQAKTQEIIPNAVLPEVDQEDTHINNEQNKAGVQAAGDQNIPAVIHDETSVNNIPPNVEAKSTVGDKSSETPETGQKGNKPEIANDDKSNADNILSKPENASPSIIETPLEPSNEKKVESSIPNPNANPEKNPDDMDPDQDEDAMIFDTNKDGVELPDGPEYDDSDIKPPEGEVKLSPTDKGKPSETIEEGPNFPANYDNQNIDDSDSYFFSYFMMVCIMFICAYVAYHNKQKILALVVEGRKGRRSSRTRRPNSANYRKLDSNLEEAVTSSCNKNATHVIY